jgi:hypothetical protein
LLAKPGFSCTIGELQVVATAMECGCHIKDLEGKVGAIDEASGKVKVLVSMFGRETPVELDFLQIKRV